MKNFKYALTVIFLGAALTGFAQEKKSTIGFGKEIPSKKETKQKAKVGFGKEVQKEIILVPEKEDRKARKYKTKRINKTKSKAAQRGNGNAYGNHKFGREGREFGQYRAWQARNKIKKDNDILTLFKNIDGRINKPAESRKIIKIKKSEILWEYTKGNLSKSEYLNLKNELDQAEKDISTIEKMSKIRRR